MFCRQPESGPRSISGEKIFFVFSYFKGISTRWSTAPRVGLESCLRQGFKMSSAGSQRLLEAEFERNSTDLTCPKTVFIFSLYVPQTLFSIGLVRFDRSQMARVLAQFRKWSTLNKWLKKNFRVSNF